MNGEHPDVAAKIIWFAAGLTLVGGYAFIVRAGEVRIAERLAGSAAMTERLRSDDAELAARASLESERSRLRSALRVAVGSDDATQRTARFVRDSAREASEHGTTITAIVVPAATGPNATAAGLAGEPKSPGPVPIALELTVNGRYAGVLATMRALSSSRSLAAVALESVARTTADPANAAVTAALHVVLEPSPPRTATDVRARPR